MRIGYLYTASMEKTHKMLNKKKLNESYCNCAGNCQSENIVYSYILNWNKVLHWFLLNSVQIYQPKKVFQMWHIKTLNFQGGLQRKKTYHKIIWEVIKRAQPTTDGNNPICRLCLKASVGFEKKMEVVWIKKRIHAYLQTVKFN